MQKYIKQNLIQILNSSKTSESLGIPGKREDRLVPVREQAHVRVPVHVLDALPRAHVYLNFYSYSRV